MIVAVEISADEEYAKANFSKFKTLRSAFKKDGEYTRVYCNYCYVNVLSWMGYLYHYKNRNEVIPFHIWDISNKCVGVSGTLHSRIISPVKALQFEAALTSIS